MNANGCPATACNGYDPGLPMTPRRVEALRRFQVGWSIDFHRVLERLVDIDGTIVFVVEGDHPPIEIPPKP